MTWFEFKSKVDEYLAENSLDPQEIEIWYLDVTESTLKHMKVHVDKKLDGKIRLFVD